MRIHNIVQSVGHCVAFRCATFVDAKKAAKLTGRLRAHLTRVSQKHQHQVIGHEGAGRILVHRDNAVRDRVVV